MARSDCPVKIIKIRHSFNLIMLNNKIEEIFPWQEQNIILILLKISQIKSTSQNSINLVDKNKRKKSQSDDLTEESSKKRRKTNENKS